MGLVGIACEGRGTAKNFTIKGNNKGEAPESSSIAYLERFRHHVCSSGPLLPSYDATSDRSSYYSGCRISTAIYVALGNL